MRIGHKRCSRLHGPCASRRCEGGYGDSATLKNHHTARDHDRTLSRPRRVSMMALVTFRLVIVSKAWSHPSRRLLVASSQKTSVRARARRPNSPGDFRSARRRSTCSTRTHRLLRPGQPRLFDKSFSPSPTSTTARRSNLCLTMQERRSSRDFCLSLPRHHSSSRCQCRWCWSPCIRERGSRCLQARRWGIGRRAGQQDSCQFHLGSCRRPPLKLARCCTTRGR